MQTKFDLLMKEHKTKLERNTQLIRANERLVESHQELENYVKDVEKDKTDIEALLQEANTKSEA